MPTGKGSFRLFKCFGIQVYLHWSWFVVALFEIELWKGRYSSITWSVLEYLTLFVFVLVHEFGHALACRSVGGQANQIVLWPLGGVAYVSPPLRPGAYLWSIAAGPLVNVALFPILSVVWWFAKSAGWYDTAPNLYTYFVSIWFINLVLLLFNMMPVYPLDGGKIVWSVLWFFMGRARSLMVATVIGFIGGAGLCVLAVLAFLERPADGIWPGVVAAFICYQCFQGFKYAREIARVANAPRRAGFACPACKISPPAGEFWHCGRCRGKFDPFATQWVCPHCNAHYSHMVCLDCGTASPLGAWSPNAFAQL